MKGRVLGLVEEERRSHKRKQEDPQNKLCTFSNFAYGQHCSQGEKTTIPNTSSDKRSPDMLGWGGGGVCKDWESINKNTMDSTRIIFFAFLQYLLLQPL